ncbi:MAG: GerAB/ArcD/ProY family transporter [Bacillota bacterium]
MLENGRIDWKQAAWLIIISRSVTFISLEALKAPPANQQTWMVGPIALGIAMVMAVPFLILAKRFPRQTLIQYSETLLGPLGKLIGVFYVWFFIHTSAITLRHLGGFFTTAVMPETPTLVFIISLALLAASAVRNGIEVIGRTGQVIGPALLVTFILIAALVAKDVNPKALLPLFDKGFSQLLYGGLIYAPRCNEILVAAMVAPYLNLKKDINKAVFVGFAVYFLFFMLVDATVIGVFGVEQAKTLVFPFFSLTQIISIGDFLERVEIFYLTAWILCLFIKVIIFYYAAALGTAQILRLKDYKPLAFPLGTIIVILSVLLVESQVELMEFTSYKIWTFYALPFVVFLPLALLLTELVRKKGNSGS